MNANIQVNGTISCTIKDKRTGQITSQFEATNAIKANFLSGLFSLMSDGTHPTGIAPNKIKITNESPWDGGTETFNHGSTANSSALQAESDGGENSIANANSISVTFTDQEVIDTGSTTDEGLRRMSKIELISSENNTVASMEPSDTNIWPAEFQEGVTGIEYGNFSLLTMTYTLELDWSPASAGGLTAWNATYTQRIRNHLSIAGTAVSTPGYGRIQNVYNLKLHKCNAFASKAAADLDTLGTSTAGFTGANGLKNIVWSGSGTQISEPIISYQSVGFSALAPGTSTQGVHATVYYIYDGADDNSNDVGLAVVSGVYASDDNMEASDPTAWQNWNSGDHMSLRYILSVS